jgi:DNA (cytosine-5)-methyltransferase 1
VGNYSPSGHDASRIVDTVGLAPTVKENHGTVTAIVEPVRLGYIPYPNSDKPHQSNTFYDANAISPTLDTCEGGNRQVKIAEPLAYDEQNSYIRKDGTVGTLTTDGSSPKHNNRVVESEMRIRKLTPKECWRLMGFDDADFEKAAQFNSNSQLYKQAGNSIVVDVLAHIFTQML